MAVLGRLLLGSAERLDLPDLLSIDSFAAADFKYLIQSFVGSDKPYIFRGFDIIQPQDSIGTESVSVRMADSVVYYPAAGAGAFFYGLEEGNVNAQPLVPELRKNATNFIYLTFTTFDTARDNRAFWDPDQNGGDGGEFSQDVNTESVLTVQVNVSTSTFPEDTIPIAKVVVGPSVIESIQDARDMMFRLGSGGISPNPFSSYSFRELPSASYTRDEPATIMSSAFDPNPFQGGDKNIFTLKEWMDVVMTLFKEITGNTYWYQTGALAGTTPPSLADLFNDALGSTFKSKGEWQYSGAVMGEATWTEDIHHYSLNDPRDVIIRANTITLSSDDTVAWIELDRNKEFNGSMTATSWINSSNIVNGVVGSFANLTKGDWVKKKADSANRYLRVEEFYASPNLAGGTTTPALAQSIKLSANYAGTTGSEIGEYTKGEYLLSDINITSRDDASIQTAGGHFFWLAYRSDTVLGLESITPTQISVDLSEASGTQVKCTSVAHGLLDGDRITITTGSYAGTYQVEIESADIFYIKTTTVAGDESGQDAFYAIVETRARSTADGFALETAEHGFESDQKVEISGTSSAYDNEYYINVRSSTTFQIAYNALTPDPGPVDGEIVRLSRLNVRTEFGVVKIVQGESIDIGDTDTSNLLSYVGMPSLAVTKPNYATPLGYNTLFGQQNFNALSTDDLTDRASKLTSMMADRVQDRGFRITGRVNITSETNGANQDISATGTVVLVKPGSPNQTIDLTVSLPANTAAVAQINRNTNALIVMTAVSLGSPNLLAENNLILAYRLSDQNVHLWNGMTLEPFDHVNLNKPEDAQNKNVKLFVPGNVHFNPTNGLVSWDIARLVEETDVQVSSGALVPQSSYFTINSAGDATQYYVWYNVDGAGVDPAPGGLTGIVVAISSGDSANTVASLTASAIDALGDFESTSLLDVVNIKNADPGETTASADFDTNFIISTVIAGASPDPVLIIPGSVNENYIDTDTINGLGTLLVAAGESAWVRINRNAAKVFNTVETDPTIEDSDANGSIYVTLTDEVPVDQDVFVLYSNNSDNLVQFHKSEVPDANVYEEYIDVIAGIPSNNYEVQGPVSAGTQLVLPPDTRDNNTPQTYLVGRGLLEVSLNGQKILLGRDWSEVGQSLSESNKMQIDRDLEIGDVITFRIDANAGVYFASAGQSASGGDLQDAYDNGRNITVQSGQPIVISGPVSEKLVIIQGDLDVTGVIDPIGLEITPNASNPLSLTGRGLWINTSDELVFERVSSAAVNLVTDFVRRDGSSPMVSDLDMDGNFIIGLPSPTLDDHAVNKGFADATFLRIDGNVPMTGDLGMANFKIIDVGAPTDPQDAANKGYVDAETLTLLKLDGSRAMTGDLDMDGNSIANLADPVNPQDAATMQYVIDNAGATGTFTILTNGDASTINAGDIVIAGSNALEVVLADASDVETIKGFVGVAQESIAPAASGRIQLTGLVSVNSVSVLTPGQFVYASDTVPGQVDDVAPTNIGSSVFVVGIAASNTQMVINPRLRFDNENTYEEPVTVVSGAPASDNEITGPVTSGTFITLPVDSRNLDNARTYVVGRGDLEVYLRGQRLEVGVDWTEVGSLGTSSNQIQIQQDLEIDDVLIFRDSALSLTLIGSGGPATSLNDLSDVVLSSISDGDTIRFNQANARWENVPDTTGVIDTGSNVGTGAGEVFKQVSANVLEFRNIKAGYGVAVSQDATDVEIALSPVGEYFVEHKTDQTWLHVLSTIPYVMGSNTLDVYRNGVQLINSVFINSGVARYQETTRNSIHLDPGSANEFVPVASDVFSLINRDVEPAYKIAFTGQVGTTLLVPTYTMGNDSLQVFRNGLLMNSAGLGDSSTQYTETDANTITLALAAAVDDVFVVLSTNAPTSRQDIDGETGTFISGISSYTVGSDELIVYKNGVLMFNSTTLGIASDRYQETSSTSITLEEAAEATDVFTFIVK